MYFPIKPKVIDQDRSKEGDHFSKPTQYWFVNCEPKNNFIFEPRVVHEKWTILHNNNTVQRSMITKEYANRFIREFILDGEPKEEKEIRLI